MSERNTFVNDNDDDDDDDENGQEPIPSLTPPNVNLLSQRSSAAETIVPNTFETVGNQTPIVDQRGNVDFNQEKLSDISMGTQKTLKKSKSIRKEQISTEIRKLREEKEDALRINGLLNIEINNLKKENQMREDIIQELRQRLNTTIQELQRQERQSVQEMEAKLKQIEELTMRITDLEAEKEDHIQQIIELNVQLVTQRDMVQVCDERREHVSLPEMKNEQESQTAMEKKGRKGKAVLEPSSKIQRIKEKTRKEKKLEEYEYQVIEKGTKRKRASKEIKESSHSNDFESDDFIDLDNIQVKLKEKKKQLHSLKDIQSAK